MMRLIDLHEACDPTRESGLPGQEQRMASAEVYAFHDTPSIPLPLPLPKTNETGRPLHRIQAVRIQQGMSLRTAARQLAMDVRAIRAQEQASTDLRLSDLYRWQQALDVPAAELLEDALHTAEMIEAMSLPIAMMTKESINRSYETMLGEGIRFERRVFHAMFATADQKEGMNAFIAKRTPKFEHK